MKTKRIIALMLAVIMAVSIVPVTAFGNVDISDKLETSKIYTFSSTDSNAPKNNHNKIELTLSKDEKKILKVEYQSEIKAYEYRVGLSSADGKNGFVTLGTVKPKKQDNNKWNKFGFSKNLANFGVSNGYYYVNIARARTSSQTGSYDYGDGGNCYRNALIKVESKKAWFVNYSDIVKQNNSLLKSSVISNPAQFKDKSMEDVPYCLTAIVKETKSKTPSKLASEKVTLTSAKRKYIKKVATRITKNEKTKYNKAKAIYEYVATNTYFDVYSNQHYAVNTNNNPYVNIKKIEDGKKAYTCCIGFSSMMVALLRSVNIPARVMYGINLSLPQESWVTLDNAKSQREDDHYWVNFYDGKRWITADANMGTSNKWYRDRAYYEGGNAGKKAQNNFTYFDASSKQLAVSHLCLGIYSRGHISAKNDRKKLSKFLNYKDGSGVSNSKKLGGKKSVPKKKAIKTWNYDRFYANYLTGEIEKIDFANVKKLKGAADFSGCKGLKWFSVTNNKVTSLKLKGDKALLSAHASGCSLKTVDATGCKSLTALNVKFNPLTSAKYTFKKSKTATITATKGGTFYVGYEKGKHYMKATPKSGYKFLGWYNSSGKKISSSAEYKTSTKSSFKYTAKFKKR